jgi:hypothetical protein
LDTPDEKTGVSKRKKLEKVYEQSGVLPPELADEVRPEFWDEPIFNMFFEIFQRGQEFYQTIYYYQQVMDLELDGEDLTILLLLWNTASKYLSEKDKKGKETTPKNNKPASRHTGKRRR